MAFDRNEPDIPRLSLVLNELERSVGAEYWSSDVVDWSSVESVSVDNLTEKPEWSTVPWRCNCKYSATHVSPTFMALALAGYTGTHEYLQFRIARKDSQVLSYLSSGSVFIDLLGGPPPRDGTTIRISRYVRTLDICFRNGASVDFSLEGLRLWSSWQAFVWYLMLRTSHTINLEAARWSLILFEGFLHFGARADVWFDVTPWQHGLVEVTPSIKGVQSIHCSDTFPIARLAKSLGGTVTLRDLMEIWFPGQAKHLQALIGGNNAGIPDSSGHWDAMVKMSDVELADELGSIMVLFPRHGVTPFELMTLDAFDDVKEMWKEWEHR